MNPNSRTWLPYDWFKLTVAVLLALLLLALWYGPQPPTPSPTPTFTSIPFISPTAPPPSATPATAVPLTLDRPAASELVYEGMNEFGGNAESGVRVEVYGNGTLLGASTAAEGEWSVRVELLPGNLEVVARAVDDSGTMLEETDPLTWQVATLAQPLQPPVILAPTGEEPLTAGMVEFSGNAAGGVLVELTGGDEVLAQTTADELGNWTMVVELEAGEVSVIAQAFDAASGESAASAPLTLQVEPAQAEPPIGGGAGDSSTGDGTTANCGVGRIRRNTYIVAACENLTRISRILGVTLEALLAANPQIENPDLIYPNQVLNIPKPEED